MDIDSNIAALIFKYKSELYQHFKFPFIAIKHKKLKIWQIILLPILIIPALLCALIYFLLFHIAFAFNIIAALLSVVGLPFLLLGFLFSILAMPFRALWFLCCLLYISEEVDTVLNMSLQTKTTEDIIKEQERQRLSQEAEMDNNWWSE